MSFCYVTFRWLPQFIALCVRSMEFKELEIVVLRHELAILRRKTRRPAVTAVDRVFLTAASRFLARARWRSFIVTPATLLRWHRRLVAKRLLILNEQHLGQVLEVFVSHYNLQRPPASSSGGPQSTPPDTPTVAASD